MHRKGVLFGLLILGAAVAALAWPDRGKSRASRTEDTPPPHPSPRTRDPRPPNAKAPHVPAVRGRVLLASGAPGAGAQIGFGEDETVRADDQGRFRLDTPRATHVVVSLDGYAHIQRWLGPAAREQIVVLGAGAELTGSVIDEAGAPVAGIRVRCLGAAEGRADGAGRFVLRGVPMGLKLRLEAFDDERFGRAEVDVPYGAKSRATVDVRVRSQPCLVVHLRDAQDRPVKGAEVLLHSNIGLAERRPGTYRSRPVPVGEQTMMVYCPGRASVSRSFVLQGTKPNEHVVRLSDEETLRCRLVDRDDQPVAGARVTWNSLKAFAGARSDADGRFLIRGLPRTPGFVWIDPVAHARTRIADVSAGEHVFTIERAVVTGTIEPNQGETVLLVRIDDSLERIEVPLGKNGEFRILQLPVDETFTLTLALPGYAACQPTLLLLSPGEHTDLGRRHLGGHTVRGVVRLEAGEPVRDARLTIEWAEEWRRVGRVIDVDADGRFVAEHLPGDRVTAWVRAPGYAPLKWHIRPRSEPEVHLVMEPSR